MEKELKIQEAIMIFIDSRDSTKFNYIEKGPNEFKFINESNNFILSVLQDNLLEGLKFKPLGDGLLFYLFLDENMTESKKSNLIMKIIEASEKCYKDYNDNLVKKITTEDENIKFKFRLGITISYGHLGKWIHPYKSDHTDYISLDLTLIFRLNKFAKPEGIIFDNKFVNYIKKINELYKFFNKKGYLEKKIFVDDVYKSRKVWTSSEVIIEKPKTPQNQVYNKLAKFAIHCCKGIIERVIKSDRERLNKNKKAHKKYAFDAPPEIRFLLFKCTENSIDEVYAYYLQTEYMEDSNEYTQAHFDLPKEKTKLQKNNKYQNLVYECYDKKDISYYSYKYPWLKNTKKYIIETLTKFWINEEIKIQDINNINDAEMKKLQDFFSNYFIKASSSLAIPIIDADKVKWIIVLDSQHEKVFLSDFFEYLGDAIRTYYEDMKMDSEFPI